MFAESLKLIIIRSSIPIHTCYYINPLVNKITGFEVQKAPHKVFIHSNVIWEGLNCYPDRGEVGENAPFNHKIGIRTWDIFRMGLKGYNMKKLSFSFYLPKLGVSTLFNHKRLSFVEQISILLQWVTSLVSIQIHRNAFIKIADQKKLFVWCCCCCFHTLASIGTTKNYHSNLCNYVRVLSIFSFSKWLLHVYIDKKKLEYISFESQKQKSWCIDNVLFLVLILETTPSSKQCLPFQIG